MWSIRAVDGPSRTNAAAEPDDDTFGEFLSGMPDMMTTSQQPSEMLPAAEAGSHIPDNCAVAGPAAVKQNQTGENFSNGN